jgi:Response regulator containing CheY-like receiver, AAA-type ATPase, and DNA-binding domains
MAIRAEQPDVPVILMTAWGSIGLAVEGMKRGGADFITKPWSNARVADALGLSRAALYRRLEKYGIEV